MCGIVGITASNHVNQMLFDTLTVLQHRGQDAAGIVTCFNQRFAMRKNNGLVRDVMRTRHMRNLLGHIGLGHVRYPTAGTSSSTEAQPFYVNSPYGIALAHNGNLTNADEIRRHLFHAELRHTNTESDSEVLLNVFASELHKLAVLKPTPETFFKAITEVFIRCTGGYAAVVLINGHGLIGFRDPCGIRPLVVGERSVNGKKEFMIASESVALTSQGFRNFRDVAPGEAVFIDKNHQLHSSVCAKSNKHVPCMFEYVYFARPDSVMDGILVYKARAQMGVKLAQKIMKKYPDHDIDVVMPIPDTSRMAALELAHTLGVQYREGLVKNRYLGRTFIMPGQKERKRSVRQKLNVTNEAFQGRAVLLVDDSIVRGTTSREIVDMVREAGARKVYFCSAAPPVCYPNVYGIDMPVAHELIASNRSEQEIAEKIGVDLLIYQDLDDLIDAVRSAANHANGVTTFECSVFNKYYPVGNIDDTYLENLARKRNDKAKIRAEQTENSEDIEEDFLLSDDDAGHNLVG